MGQYTTMHKIERGYLTNFKWLAWAKSTNYITLYHLEPSFTFFFLKERSCFYKHWINNYFFTFYFKISILLCLRLFSTYKLSVGYITGLYNRKHRIWLEFSGRSHRECGLSIKVLNRNVRTLQNVKGIHFLRALLCYEKWRQTFICMSCFIFLILYKVGNKSIRKWKPLAGLSASGGAGRFLHLLVSLAPPTFSKIV